jgi:hypothetical protein
MVHPQAKLAVRATSRPERRFASQGQIKRPRKPCLDRPRKISVIDKEIYDDEYSEVVYDNRAVGWDHICGICFLLDGSKAGAGQANVR